MSWLKLSDDLWRHKKVAALDREDGDLLEAMGLWVLAMSWVGEGLTDGRVPVRQLRRLAGDDTEAIVSRLVRVGLWERDGDDVVFHDYLDYNPSREKVLAEREAAQERMRRVRSGERASERASEPVGARSEGSRLPSPVSRTPVHPSPGAQRAREWLTEEFGSMKKNGIADELDRVVSIHGDDVVAEALAQLPADQRRTIRQAVFGVVNLLERPANGGSAKPRGLQSDVAEAVTRA